MDTKAYIASGQLEAYALGLLSPQEATAVAAAVAAYPELAEELSKVELQLERLAQAGSVPPPPGLDNDIWTQLEAIEKPAQSIPESHPAVKRVSLFPTWAQAAALILLLGSVLLNIYFWYQQQGAQKEAAGTRQELAALQRQQHVLQQQINQFRQSSQTIFNAGSQLIPLQPVNGGQTYVLVYNAQQQLALFDMSKMPPPPDGKQYQMWVIVDGQPQSMGVMPIQKPENGMLEMQQPAIPGQQAFAISLEAEGGSPAPTEVLMLGKMKG